MKTKIMPCTCKHEFQDSLYGKNKRLFNARAGRKEHGTKAEGKAIGYRCTVCGAEAKG